MKLIANEINGEYLSDLLNEAHGQVESISAAVAYAKGSPEIIDWAVSEKVKLSLWARIDSTIPISSAIIEKMIKLNFPIKVVNDFYHPKIIILHGFGIYIGSANLTDSAWHKNIECGIFYYEDEADEIGLSYEMMEVFKRINDYSTPITPQLLEVIKRIENTHLNTKSDLTKEQNILMDEYRNSILPKLSHNFKGLIKTNKISASENRKQMFMKEWNETQTLLHKIGDLVILDKNRPSWIPSNTPKGVQVDQFLSAYYYKIVVDGNLSRHEKLHSENKPSPEAAVEKVLTWWKGLSGPLSGEGQVIFDWFPVLNAKLTKESIENWIEDDFISIATRIHAFRMNARQTRKSILGLSKDSTLDIDTRANLVAKWIWSNSQHGPISIKDAIYFLLFGGNQSDITERLFLLQNDPTKKVFKLGIGTYGEIIGWAMPDKFPPRNGRTSKALYALGYDVIIYGD